MLAPVADRTIYIILIACIHLANICCTIQHRQSFLQIPSIRVLAVQVLVLADMIPSRTAHGYFPPAATQPYFRRGPLRKMKYGKIPAPFNYVNPVDKLAELINFEGIEPAELGKRIPVWNRIEKRMIAGNAAPLRRNLAKYIETHEQCEVFVGQEKWFKRPGAIDPVTALPISETQRVVMWNPFTKKKITGNFSPTLRGLAEYLDTYPGIQVYRGQDMIENAVKEDGEEDGTGKSQSGKTNSNRDTNTFSPLQSRPLKEVCFVDSKENMDKSENQRIGEGHPSHALPANAKPIPGIYWKEKAKTGRVQRSKQSEWSEASGTVRESDSTPRNNNASPQSTVMDFLVDVPLKAKKNNAIERSPSWSNLQLWRNPHAFQCPGDNSLLSYSSYAERSAVLHEDLIDWTVELGDSPLIDRDSKFFKSLLSRHAQIYPNNECRFEVERKWEDSLDDSIDLGQIAETDPIDYYLVAGDESRHDSVS